MFFLNKPPTPAARVLPPEGEDLVLLDLPPLWEAMRSIKGGLVLRYAFKPAVKLRSFSATINPVRAMSAIAQ